MVALFGHIYNCLKIEKTQRKFLFLHFKSFGFYLERGFSRSDVLSIYSVQGLKFYRCFMFNFVNDTIDCNP
jgi:hypothetical protein